MKSLIVSAFTVAAGLFCAGVATAEGPPPRHHGPPPEAFAACKGLQAGDACNVVFHDQKMDGICRNGPDGKGELACAPSGPPPGERRGPPPEALDACKGLSAEATCSVTFRGETLAGKCKAPPDTDAPLACLPDRMPQPPHDR